MAKEDRDFFSKVYEVTRHIPPGRVTSYGSIAKYIGSPQASRMIGWALNKSASIKPFVPAHRVVNRMGLLTGKNHFPNPDMMEELLANEGIAVFNDKIINFKDIYWDPSKEL